MSVRYHEDTLTDRAKMIAVRTMLKLGPALTGGVEGRASYDTMLSTKVATAKGVTYEPAAVLGVPGWWCHPTNRGDGVILYLHGGAYVLGAAWAYRNFVGQIAQRAGVSAFCPDYALAPERPYPGALNDAVLVYRHLAVTQSRVAIVGDSAGGGLALALLSHLAHDEKASNETQPRCAVLFSPWADLSLSGSSIEDRADHDPLLTKVALAEAAAQYLAGRPTTEAGASPLKGNLSGLPPVMIHIGEDEILLDDSLRTDAAIEAVSGQIETHVWKGMIHVFPTSFAELDGAAEALDLSSAFVRRHL